MTTTTPVQDSEQTDLSGTYTGTLSCTGIPVTGEGTLTITGNQFTFTPAGGAGTANGRVASVTTRGYTAVAMQFGESVAPPPGGTSTPPVIISLRARRAGDRLTLSGVPNTPTSDCSFAPAGGTGGGRRRRRAAMNMGTTDTTMTGTTDAGAAATTDTGATTTGTGRRRRRGRRGGNTNANGNANSGGMGNMNMNR